MVAVLEQSVEMIGTSIKKLFGGMLGGRRVPIRVDISEQSANLVRLRSEGLQAKGLCELEIVSCPPYLVRYATELIVQLAANGLQTPEALADGKIVGGRLVFPEQDFIERCQLQTRAVDDGQREVLRICDVPFDAADEFPRRLIAAHLCALGSQGARESGTYFRLATEVYAPIRTASSAPLTESELNPNNFWAWEGLGSSHAESGRPAEAIAAWKHCVCYWPRCGKYMAGRMAHEMERRKVPQTALLVSFWSSVNDANIREWSSSLGVELDASALGD